MATLENRPPPSFHSEASTVAADSRCGYSLKVLKLVSDVRNNQNDKMYLPAVYCYFVDVD